MAPPTKSLKNYPPLPPKVVTIPGKDIKKVVKEPKVPKEPKEPKANRKGDDHPDWVTIPTTMALRFVKLGLVHPGDTRIDLKGLINALENLGQLKKEAEAPFDARSAIESMKAELLALQVAKPPKKKRGLVKDLIDETQETPVKKAKVAPRKRESSPEVSSDSSDEEMEVDTIPKVPKVVKKPEAIEAIKKSPKKTAIKKADTPTTAKSPAQVYEAIFKGNKGKKKEDMDGDETPKTGRSPKIWGTSTPRKSPK